MLQSIPTKNTIRWHKNVNGLIIGHTEDHAIGERFLFASSANRGGYTLIEYGDNYISVDNANSGDLVYCETDKKVYQYNVALWQVSKVKPLDPEWDAEENNG